MAYTNPILGAIQSRRATDMQNKQFAANYAMKATQLGAQMPGWKASADAQVLDNENTQLKQLASQFRETVMDRETGKFPTAQQLMADPAWNQRVVDFYNAPLIRKVWDNDGTGKSFKGFVPLNDTQAVVELTDPSKSPEERTFVTENGTSDPDDKPVLFDEEGYNRFNGTILSRLTNATGQLGSAGLQALVNQTKSARGKSQELINNSAIGGFSRLDLNAAAGTPPAPPAPPGATEIPIDRSPVEVPNAFGTEGGLSFNIGKRDPGKRRGPQPKNVVLRKALENTDTASSLSQYTPDELNKIPDTMLQSAAKFHEDAIKDNSQQRVIKKGGRGKGEKQPLTEDQQAAIAQHTAALDQIKELAASRVSVGNATDQNTMASKATNNAVKTESVTPSMLADPAKVTALDASIKAKVGSKPEDIGKAVATAGEKIGSIKPNKPFTYKDAYQLDLLKAFGVIDQATFNRVLELGVFSKDTIDLVNNNVTAHAKLVQEQMGNDAAARAAAILAKAKLEEDKGNGDFLDVQQSLDTIYDANPDGYFTALFSSHSVDQLSVPQAAHLSVQMGQKLNEKFDISWYSDPIDFFTQGNAKKENAAVGLRNYALTKDGRVVNIDPATGQEKGDADVRLSSFSADEQTYLRKELKSPYDTRARNVEREYLLIEKKIRDGLVSAQQMPAVQARLEILEEIATALEAQKGGG